MRLFPFLCFSVIFIALVMVVIGKGERDRRLVPVVLLVAELLLILQYEGIVDTPIGDRADARNLLCGTVVVAAFVELLRAGEKTFPLLAFFVGLQQLLVSLGVLHGVSI